MPAQCPCASCRASSLEDIEKAERKPDYVLKNVAEIADILKSTHVIYRMLFNFRTRCVIIA